MNEERIKKCLTLFRDRDGYRPIEFEHLPKGVQKRLDEKTRIKRRARKLDALIAKHLVTRYPRGSMFVHMKKMYGKVIGAEAVHIVGATDDGQIEFMYRDGRTDTYEASTFMFAFAPMPEGFEG